MEKIEKNTTIIIIINIILTVLVIFFIFLFSSASNEKLSAKDIQWKKDYASVLLDKGLYLPAIEEYKICAENEKNKDNAANLYYIIGNIYMDNLKDYQNALAEYYKSKYLAPDSKVITNVNTRIVECLERLGKSDDAQLELEEMTSIQPTQKEKSKSGIVVAKIGKREITSDEVNSEIEKLPLEKRNEIENNKMKKIEFLKQYISSELMYDMAKRKGYDKDAKIIDTLFQIKKGLMINKLYEDEIGKKINIRDSELELYYKANRDKYKNKSFDEAKESVLNDLKQERIKEESDELIKRMLKAQEVVIYDDRL